MKNYFHYPLRWMRLTNRYIWLSLLLVFPYFVNGQFGPQNIITTQADKAQSVYAADLNGDGYMDVLSASSMDAKIAWYENLALTATHEITTYRSLIIYPNPTNEIVHITTDQPFDFEVYLFDFTGRVLIRGKNIHQIDVSQIPSGIYSLQIKDTDSGQGITEKIIVER